MPKIRQCHIQRILLARLKNKLTLCSIPGVVNVIGFKTVPQDRGLPEDTEVLLLCSVTGEDLNKLVWIRASDSSKCNQKSMTRQGYCNERFSRTSL
jgi:hypothetical protein